MNSRYIIAACAAVFGLATIPLMLWAAEGEQGRAYYLRYCGSCHGVEGKGDGTVSRSLKLKPADLTQLQRKNRESFLWRK